MRKLALLLTFVSVGCHQAQNASGTRGAAATAGPECAPDARAAVPDAEHDAVTAAVNLYFQGHATGDGNYYRKAFHPDARLFWVKAGAVSQKSSADFIAGAPGKPADDEARRVRRIAAIDVAGDAAMAKVELDYPEVRFVDYLSLLKVDGRWTIVNKIFHREDVGPSAMR